MPLGQRALSSGLREVLLSDLRTKDNVAKGRDPESLVDCRWIRRLAFWPHGQRGAHALPAMLSAKAEGKYCAPESAKIFFAREA